MNIFDTPDQALYRSKMMISIPSLADIYAGRVDKIVETHYPTVFSLINIAAFDLGSRVSGLYNRPILWRGWYDDADAFIRFALDHFDPVMMMLLMDVMFSVHRLPLNRQKMPAFEEMQDRYHETFSERQRLAYTEPKPKKPTLLVSELVIRSILSGELLSIKDLTSFNSKDVAEAVVAHLVATQPPEDGADLDAWRAEADTFIGFIDRNLGYGEKIAILKLMVTKHKMRLGVLPNFDRVMREMRTYFLED